MIIKQSFFLIILLLGLIEFNEEYKYDFIARQTIKYALELDSLNIAASDTNKLTVDSQVNKGTFVQLITPCNSL